MFKREKSENIDVQVTPNKGKLKDKCIEESVIITKCSPTPSTSMSAIPSSNSPFVSGSQSSPVCLDLTGNYLVKSPSPVFVVYSDSEIVHAAKTNAMSNELFNRLVRNTISNMRSTCQGLPNPREPSSLEMEDMAKALCTRYPCTARICEEDGKTYREIVPEERENLSEMQQKQIHVS